ncbi:hypothetical protein FHU38_003422 [Saccharomonospora amisosensis]|uniref:non-specific serine/threonine protein kinase n=1 Tax=Saccharomonospora amisosensis TaxID=1128677 RepID=A0A7X5USW1_9PSEU|nr:serine/threonine-protein kinase [Saccharomonospora amisosensis]NIJ13078.1 hypothetical protein [Saccharomonospora amisosensis]
MSEVGDLLAGRYRLRRHVGTGAMGVVWEAADERLGRTVAVKQLLIQPGLDAAGAEEARQRAMREGRIAARLHHPNAIAVHDVTEDAGLPLLVMEFFPARTLADVLAREGALNAVDAARVGTQAAAALAAAHRAGIVHRDVKPANVLIAEDGTTKLADFGISHAGGDISVTRAGVVAGTPAYLAPEVARGQQPSTASDIYSLGATVYTAVEGSPPFGDDETNPLGVLHRVAAGAVPPPGRAGVLTPVLLGMLADDPRLRPTAEQARETMRAIASGQAPDLDRTQPIPAVTGSPTQALSRANAGGTRLDMSPAVGSEPVRRRTRPWAYAAAAIGAALLVTLVLTLTNGDDAPSNATARQPTTTAPTSTTRSLTPAEMEAVVADFYAQLPDNTDAAWAHLGPELRAEGRDDFDARWTRVKKVTVVSAPRSTGDDTVHVGVDLAMRGGATITEFHQFELMVLDNAVVIGTDTLLHRQRTAPPQSDKDGEGNKDEEKSKGKDDKKDEDG